jgi:hypothetical protein
MSFRSGFNSDLVLNNLRITGKLVLNNGNDSSELEAETINCTGLATLGELTVTGDTNLTNVSMETLAVSGDTQMDNLDVTGLATVAALTVPGTSELSTVAVSGSATVQTLTVSGNTSLDTTDVHGNIVTNNQTVTPAQLGYVSGVTSSIQTQLNAKANLASPTFTGTVTVPNILANNETVTPAQLGYVSGVTSSVQTQLNAKANLASPTFTGTVTLPTTDCDGVLTASGIDTTTLTATGESTLQNVTANNMTVSGNLTVTGQIVNSVASNMEIVSVQITGTGGQVSGTFPLTQNTTNTTNYTVFPAIYYAYSGSSGGTYSVGDASKSIEGMVFISKRTTSSFVYTFNKSTSDSANYWLNCLVVYGAPGASSVPVSNT